MMQEALKRRRNSGGCRGNLVLFGVQHPKAITAGLLIAELNADI